ncbi:hypothetical protein BABINDRAFT_161755 [Babjeviella inositovora NRRL Y-12698]|uniref:[Histone H3]-trimethyl-L-lysine(4) demethylase n=1 Tax=Babjeviella inositovora NRRL Y-12698 TaxID=984486 RepID=A0A1E3QQW2_9ASCO|nr:uncharacterized protein BABINDRAFT_161755 [Babjeviella inositovora NRRL Y-12698]ODQ79347.1 hypothetical protein BABINDRAFT_161755 [Babjeviella inositovora NRRL Y-12698]
MAPRVLEAPVVYPSEREFNDPITYLSSPEVVALGEKYGIIKIVPPRTWKPPFSLADSFTFSTRLQKLSDLGLRTRSRVFFKKGLNRYWAMIKRKSNLKTFFKLDHRKIFYYDLHMEVEKRGGWEGLDTCLTEVAAEFGLTKPDRAQELKEIYQARIKDYAAFLSRNDGKIADFPETDVEDEMDRCLVCHGFDNPEHTLLCDSCDNAYHMTCVDPPLAEVPVGNWYCDKCVIGTGDFGFEEEDEQYSLDEFQRMCADFDEELYEDMYDGRKPTIKQLEETFWDLIENENNLEVKYGADIHNFSPGEISGFPMFSNPSVNRQDPAVQRYINHPFNLIKLPFARGSLLNYLDTSISGMTVPWIYVGSLFSTFCWHVEDHYTLSANYCHKGATKKWYGIPSYDAARFEALMRNAAPDLFKKQPDLLHQLVTLMSPRELTANGITVVSADQNPNEFIITFPKVYHAGFNCGFNVNEAVNFTMNNWINYGARAVQDYRLIKKENVFNFSNVLHNILDDFAVFYEMFKVARMENPQLTLPQRLNQNYLQLVEDSFRNFKEDFEVHDREWTENWDFLLLLNTQCVTQLRNTKKRTLQSEEEYIRRFQSEDQEPNEIMCAECKTLPSYQYFIVQNSVTPMAKEEIPEVVVLESHPNHLQTPVSSPKRVRLSHLNLQVHHSSITPFPSPQYGISPPAAKKTKEITEIVPRQSKMATMSKMAPKMASKMSPVKRSKESIFDQPQTILCLNDFLKIFRDPITCPATSKIQVVIQQSPQELRDFINATEVLLNGYRNVFHSV